MSVQASSADIARLQSMLRETERRLQESERQILALAGTRDALEREAAAARGAARAAEAQLAELQSHVGAYRAELASSSGRTHSSANGCATAQHAAPPARSPFAHVPAARTSDRAGTLAATPLARSLFGASQPPPMRGAVPQLAASLPHAAPPTLGTPQPPRRATADAQPMLAHVHSAPPQQAHVRVSPLLPDMKSPRLTDAARARFGSVPSSPATPAAAAAAAAAAVAVHHANRQDGPLGHAVTYPPAAHAPIVATGPLAAKRSPRPSTPQLQAPRSPDTSPARGVLGAEPRRLAASTTHSRTAPAVRLDSRAARSQGGAAAAQQGSSTALSNEAVAMPRGAAPSTASAIPRAVRHSPLNNPLRAAAAPSLPSQGSGSHSDSNDIAWPAAMSNGSASAPFAAHSTAMRRLSAGALGLPTPPPAARGIASTYAAQQRAAQEPL